MDSLPPEPDSPRGGRLATNIVHFARTLRTAGLAVGPGHVLRAIEAVETAGLRSREDFYWTLHSVFVNRRDQREIFDQAFHVYWRNPRLLEKMLEMLLPSVGVPPGEEETMRHLTVAVCSVVFAAVARVLERLAPLRAEVVASDPPVRVVQAVSMKQDEVDAWLTWELRSVGDGSWTYVRLVHDEVDTLAGPPPDLEPVLTLLSELLAAPERG